MTRNDDLSSRVSDFARRVKQEEADKAEMEEREGERRKRFLDEFRGQCNQVVIPLFREVARNPDLARAEGVSVNVSDDRTSVSLRVSTPSRSGELRYSAEADREQVMREGVPTSAGLSQYPRYEPRPIGLEGLAANHVKADIGEFLDNLFVSG